MAEVVVDVVAASPSTSTLYPVTRVSSVDADHDTDTLVPSAVAVTSCGTLGAVVSSVGASSPNSRS